jgi:plastocyanin
LKQQLIAVAVVAAAAAAAAVPAFAATKTVRVDDNVFGPRSTAVKKNDTIRFRWVGDAPHNVQRTRGPSFRTISTRRNGSVSRKFTRKGLVKLTCTIHPGMDLSVRVR